MKLHGWGTRICGEGKNPGLRSETWGTRICDALRMTTLITMAVMIGCKARLEAPGSVVMVIESSPNNLDLRQGTDAQSERVGGLIFDALVKKDEHFNLQPWLATSWEQPDALTWVFHLRDGVTFQDRRALTGGSGCGVQHTQHDRRDAYYG